jgi:pyruvate dehydrogenase E1 component alpha subunit
VAVTVARRLTDGPQSDDQPFEVRLSDEAFETYELDPPPYTLETTKKELKQMYYDMVAMRYAVPAAPAPALAPPAR